MKKLPLPLMMPLAPLVNVVSYVPMLLPASIWMTPLLVRLWNCTPPAVARSVPLLVSVPGVAMNSVEPAESAESVPLLMMLSGVEP